MNMRRAVIVLHSALTPNAVVEALRSSVDEEHRTLFSRSGYRGGRPLLGEVSENTFRLQKRKYYRNDFARQFYARFAPEMGGTRIEGYFDTPRWAKYFTRIWLALALLMSTPIFVLTVMDMSTGSAYMSGDKWVGLVVPLVLVSAGILLPKFGRLLDRNNERFILEHLQNNLAARVGVLEAGGPSI
jgi:hypothetical protein